MPSFLTTALYGGKDGDVVDDIFHRTLTGEYVINSDSKKSLDLNHPIQKIELATGWIVDGFTVTYQCSDGTSAVISHGSCSPKFPPGSTVTFGPNEVLVCVFGRAGRQAYYNRDMINSMGFVIFDKVSMAVRIVQPVGNGANSNEGTPYCVSDVIAFGGFAKRDSDVPDGKLRLCGITFYKNI